VTLTQLLRLAASIAQWARTHAMTDSNGLSAWLCVRMHRWMEWVAGWLGASAGGDGTASLRASIVWALKVDCPVSSTRAQPGGVDTHAYWTGLRTGTIVLSVLSKEFTLRRAHTAWCLQPPVRSPVTGHATTSITVCGMAWATHRMFHTYPVDTCTSVLRP
jgi:hypothetical protein